MQRNRITAVLSCVLILLQPVALAQKQQPKKSRSVKADARDWATRTLDTMTLEEKVGQMLVPALQPVFMNQQSTNWVEIERNLMKFHAGGYHAFGGDPAALAVLLNRLQRTAKHPLLITADLEGGPGYQFRGATRLPRGMALGATGSEQLAYEAGKIAAVQGRAMGVAVNFYPVVDVNNNPRNPIINIRSFGEDVSAVSRMAQAYIRGAQENGEIATAKHFPGHGDTSQDSHMELAVIDVNRERLNQVELPPFRAAVEAGVGAVMTAHIALPQIEPEKGLPATLSRMINTDVLRGDLKFGGLLFTDAMDMRGVAAHYSPEDATLRAVQAGADVILFPPSMEKSFNAILDAVKTGALPLERIEASARRILQAKMRLGLDANRAIDLAQLETLVGNPEHEALAQKMMESALTLVRNDNAAVPLKLSPEQSVLYINLLDSRIGWREGTPGFIFRRELAARHSNIVDVTVDDRTTQESIEILKKFSSAMDVVVVTAAVRVEGYRGRIDLAEEQLDLLRHLSRQKKPFAFVLFGSPYLLTAVPELPSYLLTYEYYPEAERAAVRGILGEIPITGRLPISLPGTHAIGHGLQTSGPAQVSAP